VDLASAIVIARDPTGFGDEEARLARLELIDEIRRLEVLVMRAWRLHTATSWPLVARRYGGSEAFVREAQAVWEKEIRRASRRSLRQRRRTTARRRRSPTRRGPTNN
jgi:hypothetical protein